MTQRSFSEIGKYIISAVILAVAGLGAFGLIASREKPPTRQSIPLIPLVRTVPAAVFEGQLDLEVSGLVVPYREINLSSQVSGRVLKKSEMCQAGNYVSAGTELLIIDPTDYQLEIDRLASELEQAGVMLEELASEMAGDDKSIELAQREVDLAQREFNRLQGLGNAVSQSEVDQVQRSQIAAQRALTTLENNVAVLETRKNRLNAAKALAESQLKKANLNRERTVIKAPTDGVIVEEMVEEDDFVQIGEKVVVFEDTSRAEVICNLRSDQVDWIIENQLAPPQSSEASAAYQLPPTNVTIWANLAGEQVSWNGVLRRFDGIGLDEMTKTVPCRIEVEQPLRDTPGGPKALVRGMYVRVRLEIDTGPMAGVGRRFAQFPAVAVQPGNFIWTVKDNRLALKRVRIVDYQEPVADSAEPTMVVVKLDEAIELGEKIVITPLNQPTVGAQVEEESS